MKIVNENSFTGSVFKNVENFGRNIHREIFFSYYGLKKVFRHICVWLLVLIPKLNTNELYYLCSVYKTLIPDVLVSE